MRSGSGLNLPNANTLKIGSTSYLGDNSASRIIPHGLPSIPIQILIQSSDYFSLWMNTMTGRPMVFVFAGVTTQHGIVAVDSTDIQVSDAAFEKLNSNGETYYVAMWYI